MDARGDLLIHTDSGAIRQPKPLVYREQSGARKEIAGGYMLVGSRRLGFHVGNYDQSKPLIIDPMLLYSTYLGGSGDDFGFSIAVDPAGNTYVTGRTNSANFPTTTGALDTTSNGADDAFVTKLDPTGASLVYSTYLGGSSTDVGYRIAVDPAGNAYVAGYTNSANFPTTPVAFDTTFNGGPLDAFVTKLNPSGASLVYSTYLGGGNEDVGQAIAVDPAGNVYVGGWTDSANFPTTVGAFDTTYSGNPGGIISNYDGFVTKLNSIGASPVYSTYLGAGNPDWVYAIAVDTAGNAHVAGYTGSANFPTTPGAFNTSFNGGDYDAFVTKLNATGAAPLLYSTYLGGSSTDLILGIAVDSAGNAYAAGRTNSANFPTTTGVFDTSHNGGLDVFVTKLPPTGASLVYSTYLGGGGDDYGAAITVDPAGTSACVTGSTNSAKFPDHNRRIRYDSQWWL